MGHRRQDRHGLAPDPAGLHRHGLGHRQAPRVTPPASLFSPEHIKPFVQNALGCDCPEEVFRSIELRSNARLNSFIVLDHAIVIGNRLLIYIAEAGSAGCIEEHLPVIVRSGRNERDEKGLNRFRLVLASDTPDDLRLAAEKPFEESRGNDEKVHLHVIKKSQVLFTAAVEARSRRL